MLFSKLAAVYKVYSRALVAGLLVLLAAACSSTENKPPEPTELESIPNSGLAPDTLWRANVGDIEKEPAGFRTAVDQGVVFAADEKGEVKALNLDKGKRLWRVDLDKPLSAGPGLADDLVLVGTHDGEVLALDRRDGSERWAIQLSGEVLAPPRGDDTVVVVRCFDGRVYGLA
ncbi:MAG: PQQ-binding-like beta-propeller repeat protein, partial [Salinisphaeraceae bacterium]|nr:PQQ-binding-like beta-propeller repeat protein [Salinisphaeraceae bacterium]